MKNDENLGKMMGNLGKMMGNLGTMMENLGKMMGKMWKIQGKCRTMNHGFLENPDQKWRFIAGESSKVIVQPTRSCDPG